MRESTTAMNSMTASDSPTPNDSSGSGGGGSGKKVRKPYTITKSRESWTDEEHDKFIEALQLFDRDWKKIEDFIGSKSVIQIRSHAQKYFLKVQKSGTVAHVPPPRPKRKAAHPYPQKAPRNVLAPLQASMAYPSSLNSVVPGYPSWDDAPMIANVPSAGIFPAHDEYSLHGAAQDEYSLHGAEGLPDFAEVYSFIGSMFDPDSEGHQQKLKEMDPINFETVLLLMRNLTINLSNPDCGPLKKALSSSYDSDSKRVEAASVDAFNTDNYDLTC